MRETLSTIRERLTSLTERDFATEATLSSLDGKAATETTLSSVNSNVQAVQPRTQPSGDRYTTRSTFGEALADGRAFVHDTGTMTIADSFNVLFENPTTDHLAVINKVVTNSDTEATPEVLVNPTSDLPTTDRGDMNLNTTGSATQMNMYADDQTTPMSGGGTGVYITLTSGFDTREYALALGPGDTVGFATSGSTLTDANVKMALFYQEVAL